MGGIKEGGAGTDQEGVEFVGVVLGFGVGTTIKCLNINYQGVIHLDFIRIHFLMSSIVVMSTI